MGFSDKLKSSISNVKSSAKYIADQTVSGLNNVVFNQPPNGANAGQANPEVANTEAANNSQPAVNTPVNSEVADASNPVPAANNPGPAKTFKSIREESKALKAPLEGAIARYGVIYVGGLKQYPKRKIGEIGLNIMPDRFVFTKTSSTKDWFDRVEIPYNKVHKIEIVERTITNAEAFLGSSSGLASMNQKNNLEFLFDDEEGTETMLRVEMLTGVSIYAQAGKCREFMDVLRQNKIFGKFKSAQPAAPAPQQTGGGEDVIEKIKKLSELKEMGILSEEEFNAKKSELLLKI